jgi:hypothetical protein
MPGPLSHLRTVKERPFPFVPLPTAAEEPQRPHQCVPGTWGLEPRQLGRKRVGTYMTTVPWGLEPSVRCVGRFLGELHRI